MSDDLALVRTSICTVCRMRVAAGSKCHSVQDTLTERGRAKIEKALCRRPRKITALEHRARWLTRMVAKLTGYGITPVLGLALAAIKGTDPLLAVGVVTAALMPVVALSQNAFGSGDVGDRKKVTRILKLVRGAQSRRLALPAGGTPGSTSGQESLVSPAGGVSCLAYRTELHDSKANPTTLMLCDSYTAGFVVETADGEIQIPPGRITLLPEPEKQNSTRRKELTKRLQPLDISLISFDEVHELTLRVSTQVVVRNTLETVFARDSENIGYRSQPTRMLKPKGVPVIEIVLAA